MDLAPEDFPSEARDKTLTDTPHNHSLSRRALLGQAMTVVGLTAAQAILNPLRAEIPSEATDPTTVPGTPPTEYGQR
ncbi:hypothetical protein [Candidatus Nitrospira salsa]